MTSHNALEYYDQDTIDTVCALLYYVDNYGCSGLSADQKYMMKQAFLWTALNHVSGWYSGGDYVEINYGNGLTCSCGYPAAGHYRDLYDDGLRWLDANHDNFEASGEIFTSGENQPLSRWSYEFHPTGYAILQKISSNPDSLPEIPVTVWPGQNTAYTRKKTAEIKLVLSSLTAAETQTGSN